MNDRNDSGDPEATLASLFERTARTLSHEGRARLGRHAREVADAKRRSTLRAFGVWAPALAAAAAVAYLAVPMRHGAREGSDAARPSSVAGAAGGTSTMARAADQTSATPRSVPAPPAAAAEEGMDREDPAFLVLEGEPSDVEPFDLGPLMGGQDDDAPGLRTGRRVFGERRMERVPQ